MKPFGNGCKFDGLFACAGKCQCPANTEMLGEFAASSSLLPVGRQPYKLIQLCELHHLGHLDCPNCQFIEPIDDAVIAETHVLVPRDLKCHKCGSSVGRQLEPTPEFVKLAMGLAKTGEMLKGPARNIMEQIKSGMDAASLPVGESRHAFPDAFTIEVELEDDGRWLAEVDEVPGAMAYGSQPSDAILAVLEIAKIENRAGLGESREPLPGDVPKSSNETRNT